MTDGPWTQHQYLLSRLTEIKGPAKKKKESPTMCAIKKNNQSTGREGNQKRNPSQINRNQNQRPIDRSEPARSRACHAETSSQ